MSLFAFEPVDLPPAVPALRREVREFLEQALAGRPAQARINSWGIFDRPFSLELGRRGWIGMTWPARYGGHERHAVERYVVLEELLAAGAPVGAHWIADRQSGPALLRYGTDAQRERYLPGMARGEIACCIGMSEPNAGSDLAAVRTRAEHLADGRWRINGQKIWTTNAQHCELMIVLVRTQPLDEANRQAGLSQFLVDLRTPGIRIRPIPDLVGDTHFNEVFFEDCVVGPEAVLGAEGQGWKQVTAELSLERSGPERYLSSLALYLEWLRVAGPEARPDTAATAGRIAADLWTLRQMSLSVAGQLAEGKDPSLEAAVVKDLGNAFEQQIPLTLQALSDASLTVANDRDFVRTLGLLLQTAPSFSLRGGTREILRGIIARGLGLR